MTDTDEATRTRKFSGRAALAAVALLGVGGAVGATAARMTGPAIEVAPLAPVAIASLKSRDGLVTIRGKVGETYGNNFIVADGSGRTLVNGGPRANGLITAGQTVTIQGWNRDGTVLATFLVGTDGTVTPLGPMGPRHGLHGPRGPHDGPEGPAPDGPGDPDAAPPPPPPVAAAEPTGNSVR